MAIQPMRDTVRFFISSIHYSPHYDFPELQRMSASLILGGFDASRFVSSNLVFELTDDNSHDPIVGVQKISVIGLALELLPSPISAFMQPCLISGFR